MKTNCRLLQEILQDVGGAFAVLLGYIGDQTGVYAALRDNGPCTSDALARACNVDARYLQEWLSAQAAAGYVLYHPETDRFSLSPEQATTLAQEGHPAFLQGFFQLLTAQFTTHESDRNVPDWRWKALGRPSWMLLLRYRQVLPSRL
ncbi:hypothetical protein ACFQEX_22050 [Roseibium salinum]|uniref:hypothetical protein n=1 Tax=Roseibium salinum TaxID=1604349 RepID=UPI003611D9A8